MRRAGRSFGEVLLSSIVASLAIGCGGGPSKVQDASAGGSDAGPDGPRTDAGIDAPVDGQIDAGGTFVCDPIHQTGCGAGEKCDIAATGTFGCVRDGTLGDFRACGDKDQPNDCTAGFTCSGTFSAAHRCTRLCSQLESSCLRGERCDTEHMTRDGKQYLTCTTHEACNPILDDCAEPNTHCTHLVVLSACKIPGMAVDGTVCEIRPGDTQDCVAGSACLNVGPGDVFRCVRMCNPAGGDPACPTGVTCTPFVTVGPQDVGICPPT